MRGRLTASYRRWVRWYPRAWRLANEEAMLGVLLDVAEGEGRNALSVGERAALVVNGLGARFDLIVPGAVRDGVASGALALAAAFGALELVFDEWAPFAAKSRGDFVRAMQQWDGPGRHVGFLGLMTPFAVVAALWIVAAVLAYARRRGAARAVMGLAGLVALAIIALMTTGLAAWAGLDRAPLGFAALVSAFGAIGSPRSRRSLAIAAGAWLLGLALPFVAGEGFFLVHWALQYHPVEEFFGLATPVSYAVSLALLAALVLFMARRRTAAAVVVLSTLPWAALWLIGPGWFLAWGGSPELGDLTMLGGYLVAVTLAAVRLGSRAAATRPDSAPERQ